MTLTQSMQSENIADGKSVLIAVSASVAIYKTLSLIRLLKRENLQVTCVMTPQAVKFVAPILFATLSGNPVMTDVGYLDNSDISHIKLARNCDVMLTAPATANVIGKFANGIADDLVSTTFIACDRPKLIAPAMNSVMYESKAMQRNLATLQADGVQIIEPLVSCLACGEQGKGKMAEPETMCTMIMNLLNDHAN